MWAYAGTETRNKYVVFLKGKKGNLNSTQVKTALGDAVVHTLTTQGLSWRLKNGNGKGHTNSFLALAV